jgi:hypothetical protein
MKDTTLARHLLRTHRWDTVLCENVPIEQCPGCSQIYFPAPVAELFERIRKGEVAPTHTVTLEMPACSCEQLLAA